MFWIEEDTPDRYWFLHTDSALCILHGLNYTIVLNLYGEKRPWLSIKFSSIKGIKFQMSYCLKFFCTLRILVRNNRLSVSFSLCFLNQLALPFSSETLENPCVPRGTAFDWAIADLGLPATSQLTWRAEGRSPTVFCHRNVTALVPWTLLSSF